VRRDCCHAGEVALTTATDLRKGQVPWNKGTGGCKRGHDPAEYRPSPSGIGICYECKRENGARYREENRYNLRLTNRVKRYSLTKPELQEMLVKQQGCCAICDSPFFSDKFRIDHDHQTGQVRGLLCVACNTALGLLDDNPGTAKRAMEYLSDHKH